VCSTDDVRLYQEEACLLRQRLDKYEHLASVFDKFAPLLTHFECAFNVLTPKFLKTSTVIFSVEILDRCFSLFRINYFPSDLAQ